jgi:hypothetical protein
MMRFGTAGIAAVAVSMHVAAPVIVAAEKDDIGDGWADDNCASAIGTHVADATVKDDQNSRAERG